MPSPGTAGMSRQGVEKHSGACLGPGPCNSGDSRPRHGPPPAAVQEAIAENGGRKPVRRPHRRPAIAKPYHSSRSSLSAVRRRSISSLTDHQESARAMRYPLGRDARPGPI